METKVWVEKTWISTYEIGEAEKNPIFLDKRVYQGSSGKVYPYPTVETIGTEKKKKEYIAVYLENEYLKVMVLPELGGRIQRAYDKTNQYDFVYYNHVIKPALVGLTGPWISGGIEFNWPQHHRPTTFLPVDYKIEEHEDGSVSVLCHDVDQMYGTKGITKITLYPEKAYIEITGQLYNRTALPQTFLWWANPAVPVNENTQSIFPPDVHAVMDHGKRDVSRFPIATGVYYKHDYSEGVDISRYKNIPVPTSYMAEKSKYDFVGGYDYGKKAGILHVADHHISPGKKQWTWGCGDFGQAWDRNLTDEDGPYIELMTGVYTDNQPDFTWLKPFEEKTFTQYFMPYKEIGNVKNATVDAAVHVSCENGSASIAVYATSIHERARIVLKAKDTILLDDMVRLSPVDIYRKTVPMEQWKEEDLDLAVYGEEGCMVEYHPEPTEIPEIPEAAKAAKDPKEILTNEELYLTGQHLEQYRHATYLPDPYYLEGLKRDPEDIRINHAYGLLLLRRGNFEEAEGYFRRALKRLIERNPNPYDSEPYYSLGLALLYQEKEEEAYDAFYKATWSNEQQEMSFYYLAILDARKQNWKRAYGHIERALVKNMHNIKARGLKAYLLRKLGKTEDAKKWIAENINLDPFDFVSGYEDILLDPENERKKNDLKQKIRDFQENYLMTARDYAEMGAYTEAIRVLEDCKKPYPMIAYYMAYYMAKKDKAEEAEAFLRVAEKELPDYCFPNKLEDIQVLSFAIKNGCRAKAPYYLGNLFYDKMQWEKAVKLWEMSEAEDPEFATVHRNLALAYYNKKKDSVRAREEMEKAFLLNEEDARVFLELDQLYKKLGETPSERLKRYEAHQNLVVKRDDLYVEYITLINQTGDPYRAYHCMQNHIFHPWEGGEGKITTQYTLSLVELAKKAIREKDYKNAEDMLRKSLVYPHNLGEGKLEGTKDNHVYYYLGQTLKAQGRNEEAKVCYERASIGTDEPAGAMYYNDQPADMILYQGLAKLQLGKKKEANSRFYRLIDYGERHLRDEMKIEYFAVSLPDFLIFEEDYNKRNQVHCYYLMALGNIGLGNREKAEEYLSYALALDPSHMMCNFYQGWYRS